MTDVDSNDRHDRPTPPLPPPLLPPLPEPPGGGPITPSPPGEPQKSPPLAAVLSFILPGLGHLYADSRQRAGMLFASFALAILLIIFVSWPFVFVCAFLWFFGMLDAFREAQLFNLGETERAAGAPRRGGDLLFGSFLVVGGCLLLLAGLGLDVDRFFRDWWPALVVAAGLYFVIGALRDRTRQPE
ncbi:MAG TPA: hypothetical protein PKJ99_03265 [Thermoanaerobaculales bacterium]|mgnify:CR=1 FL=1|nr:hypothetical protein [Thermoanaerobaculales bacterium]HQL29964.1 hypothetical protein [Thermoanaerobaculales bacterium]HQN94921.1 hypothetical protein [Thermoanaerobaculales bacterium]HQP44287.1 hypothetical protein [Thermoanaerobaculales bacterium]